MAEVLIAFVVLTLAFFVSCALGAGMAVRAIARRNRLAPKLPTAAPTAWLWSPGAGARQHRRLRRCVIAVLAAAPPPPRRRGRSRRRTAEGSQGWPALADAAAELSRHAVEVDRRVVLAAHARRARSLEAEVVEVERMTSRVLTLAQSWGANVTWGGIELGDRLTALEHATAEVAALHA